MTVADLATLKVWLGVTGTTDDANLQSALDQSVSNITPKVYPEFVVLDDVQGAMLDQASRWYQRRRSPEGVSGFGEFGVVRVSTIDPDIRAKLRPYLDLSKAGVA